MDPGTRKPLKYMILLQMSSDAGVRLSYDEDLMSLTQKHVKVFFLDRKQSD